MKTMLRLKGFNYRRPFFYMVTLRRRANLPAFSQIAGAADPPKDAKGRPMYLIANEITRAFAREIREFAGKWRGIAPIECFDRDGRKRLYGKRRLWYNPSLPLHR